MLNDATTVPMPIFSSNEEFEIMISVGDSISSLMITLISSEKIERSNAERVATLTVPSGLSSNAPAPISVTLSGITTLVN